MDTLANTHGPLEPLTESEIQSLPAMPVGDGTRSNAQIVNLALRNGYTTIPYDGGGEELLIKDGIARVPVADIHPLYSAIMSLVTARQHKSADDMSQRLL